MEKKNILNTLREKNNNNKLQNSIYINLIFIF